MAQSVEHVIGNDEVISSILITSSKKAKRISVLPFLILWTKFNGCGILLIESVTGLDEEELTPSCPPAGSFLNFVLTKPFFVVY